MHTPRRYISKFGYILLLLGVGGGIALTPIALLQHVIWFINDEVMNLLHFPAFFLLACLIPKSHLSNTRVMVAWFLLPIVVELSQWWVGRTCDMVDAIWGVWAMLCAVLWGKPQRYLRVIFLLPYSVAVTHFFVVSLYPVFHLPLVSNMESRLLMAQISNVGEGREKTIDQQWLDAKRSSVLTLSKQKYPWSGIRVGYPWGLDARAYKGLKFELKTEDVPLQIDVKIAGLTKYQLNTKMITKPNWTEIIVEFDKSDLSLDWSKIDHFAVYYASESGPEFIEIDSLMFF